MRTSHVLRLMVLALAAVGLGAFVSSGAWAKVAVIETNDGRTLEGELISEDDQRVVLVISTIRTPIKRSDIASITIKKTHQEIYAERRSKIDDDDLDGRYNLAYDMYEIGALDIAMAEMDDLAELYPDSVKVKRLQGVVREAVVLRDDREQAREAEATGVSEPRPSVRPTQPRSSTPAENEDQTIRQLQLTDEQINLIRLWELPEDLSALKPRIMISRDTIETLLKDYSNQSEIPKGREEQNKLRRAPGWEQVPYFFAVRARELYPEIRVVEDPPVMQTYRRLVSPYVVSYFSRHFGQGQVPSLKLFGNRGERARAMYTDFYILTRFEQDGISAIDRQVPADSLLLQWGLPRDKARFPAPDVQGWRPYFTGTDDPKYIAMVDWIGTLYPSPEYGISYAMPAAVPVVEE